MRGVPALGAGGRTFESCHPDFINLIISSIMGVFVRTSPGFSPFLRSPDSQRQFCVWEIWVLCVLWVYSELQKWEFLLGRRRFSFIQAQANKEYMPIGYGLIVLPGLQIDSTKRATNRLPQVPQLGGKKAVFEG